MPEYLALSREVSVKVGPTFEPSDLHDLLLLLQIPDVTGPVPELQAFIICRSLGWSWNPVFRM